MFKLKYSKLKTTVAVLAAIGSSIATADVTRTLASPSGTPTADEIIDQVFFVNHFYAFDNYGIGKKGKKNYRSYQ